MKSLFEHPRPVSPSRPWAYLETYGGFFLHCGALRFGVPGEGDDHQLHGELPNAPYQEAWLEVGEDAERGPYIALSGRYTHKRSFTHSYEAVPRVALHAGATTVPVSMALRNDFHKPMDLMYMAHANFRPRPGGRLVYTAESTPESVKLRASIPGHVTPTPEYLAFLERVGRDPSPLDQLTPEVLASLDPECVFYVDYQHDDEGHAHTMQVLPGGGGAHYIRHSPAQLPMGVRWMVVDGSQEALGMCLPATAHPEGYTIEAAKGNVRSLEAGGTVRFDLECGLLDAAAATRMEHHIEGVLS